jgi:hypothetical protein
MNRMTQIMQENMEVAFYFFLLDIMQKVQERGSAFISEMAASVWEHIQPDERWVYENQAQNRERNLCQVDVKNKLKPTRRCHARNWRAPKSASKQMRKDGEIEETVRVLQC